MGQYSVMSRNSLSLAPAAYSREQVRQAEAGAMAALPDGLLMQRAAAGLAQACVGALVQRRGKVRCARVVLLIGSGNNGGDTLFAGAALARRGAQVAVLPVGRKGPVGCHAEGLAALTAAGGEVIAIEGSAASRAHADVARADLVLDGVLGIGGRGALAGPAGEFAIAAGASQATVIATDLPSGVDANTGAIDDPATVVRADMTVTFGCLKAGLCVMPGSEASGEVRLVDIGLGPFLPQPPAVTVVTRDAAATWLRTPGPSDNKYSRGVVGVVAGSDKYPGAGILCTGSARLGGSGMVRYAGGAGPAVVGRWPDVVPHPDGPATAGRVEAWIFGPGAGTGSAAREELAWVLGTDQPALVDADGLTLVAQDNALRELIGDRQRRNVITVLTPHEGEFARLGFKVGSDRLASVKQAAADLGGIVLLKGSSTLVAGPGGDAWANTTSDPALATAGSGDVLSGLAGSMLAANADAALDPRGAASLVASAAYLHGRAGQIAAAPGTPVTADDVLGALPRAIAEIRR